jgi:hypothetical protein
MPNINDILAKRRKKEVAESGDLQEAIFEMADSKIVELFNRFETKALKKLQLHIQQNIDKHANGLKDGKPGKDGMSGIAGKDGKDGKDGAPGVKGDAGYIGMRGDTGPAGEAGKDGSPDTPEQLVKKINTLVQSIDIKSIKGLDIYLNGIKRSLKGRTTGKMGGGGATIAAGSGIAITKSGGVSTITATGSGSGDMIKTTYDPTSVDGDAFDMDNMAESATKKILTADERTILGNTSNTNTGDNTVATAAASQVITDNALVTVDDADAADNDYAKFTANGIEGRSYSEVRTDLGLVIGTDVLAEQTIGIADDNLVEIDGSAASKQYTRFTANGIEGRAVTSVLSDIGGAADDQTFYIGTTEVAINRASAALTLAGITLTTPDIGTPSAGVLTNCTFPTLNQNTSGTAAGLSATLAIASGGTGATTLAGASIPTYTSTNTFTNKRLTKRVVTDTDDATAVIDTDAYDEYELSAIANATEFTLTGTPTDGQTLIVKFKDAGVTKGLTWTGFTAIGVTLPTDTTAGKWHYVGCKYNSTASAWHTIAVTEEA